MQNLPGNLHDMIFKCNLLVYCHQGVTVLWQPNVRPFLSKQFDFECNSSRLKHFTRIELTFFLKLLFFSSLSRRRYEKVAEPEATE